MSEDNNSSSYNAPRKGHIVSFTITIYDVMVILILLGAAGFFAFLYDPSILIDSVIRYEYAAPIVCGIFLFFFSFLLLDKSEKEKNMPKFGHFLKFCWAMIVAAALTALVIGTFAKIFQ